MEFDDLLAANQRYAENFSLQGFDGLARRGVLMVTCMDSRLEPLTMIGLEIGDAKILRTPGGHLTEDAYRGVVLGVQLLNVDRVLIVAHNKCAMASGTDADLHHKLNSSSGVETHIVFGATPDQHARLQADVQRLRTDPLIAPKAIIGGFHYDVDAGRLTRIV